MSRRFSDFFLSVKAGVCSNLNPVILQIVMEQQSCPP